MKYSAINREKNSIQEKIFQSIIKFPGIRYRELMRLTGCSNGVLTYHLNLLDNSGKLKINRINNRVTRYYSHEISDVESKILGILRQQSTRNILIYILNHGQCSFNSLVKYTNKVPSTVSWHLTRLKETNLVKMRKQEDYNIYEISIDKTYLQDLLYRYKYSFLHEDLVENFLDMMEEF